jgi:hypothetical protein
LQQYFNGRGDIFILAGDIFPDLAIEVPLEIGSGRGLLK